MNVSKKRQLDSDVLDTIGGVAGGVGGVGASSSGGCLTAGGGNGAGLLLRGGCGTAAVMADIVPERNGKVSGCLFRKLSNIFLKNLHLHLLWFSLLRVTERDGLLSQSPQHFTSVGPTESAGGIRKPEPFAAFQSIATQNMSDSTSQSGAWFLSLCF